MIGHVTSRHHSYHLRVLYEKITTLSVGAFASAMLLITGCSTNNGNKKQRQKSVAITEQSAATEKWAEVFMDG